MIHVCAVFNIGFDKKFHKLLKLSTWKRSRMKMEKVKRVIFSAT